MGNVAQDDYRVHNFHALRNDKEALALLERIAAQVSFASICSESARFVPQDLLLS